MLLLNSNQNKLMGYNHLKIQIKNKIKQLDSKLDNKDAISTLNKKKILLFESKKILNSLKKYKYYSKKNLKFNSYLGLIINNLDFNRMHLKFNKLLRNKFFNSFFYKKEHKNYYYSLNYNNLNYSFFRKPVSKRFFITNTYFKNLELKLRENSFSISHNNNKSNINFKYNKNNNFLNRQDFDKRRLTGNLLRHHFFYRETYKDYSNSLDKLRNYNNLKFYNLFLIKQHAYSIIYYKHYLSLF